MNADEENLTSVLLFMLFDKSSCPYAALYENLLLRKLVFGLGANLKLLVLRQL